MADALVGRAPELSALRRAHLESRHRGRIVVLFGEAGIGKTALIAQAAWEAHSEGLIVLHGRCDRHLITAYEGLAEALSRYVAECPLDRLRNELGAPDRALAALIPELAQRFPDYASAEPAAAEAERRGLFGAVVTLLAGMARTAPVMLVIEDLQWAGIALLLLLRHLARALQSAPVMLVLTCREEELVSNPMAAETLSDLCRELGSQRIILGPLDTEAVAALARSLGIDVDGGGGPMAENLRARTAGNPFFVTELLRHLVESQPLNHVGCLSVADLGIPTTVAHMIRRRISGLGPVVGDALGLASVVGREFQLETVARAGGLDDEVVLDAVEEAAIARLVQEVPGKIGLYRFADGPVWEVIYQQLSATRRARLHARVALVLRTFAEHGDREIVDVAHHYWMAGPLADREEAIDYTVRAGELAAAQAAYERATVQFERSLHLGLDEPGREARRCQVLMALAMVQRKAGRVFESREAYLQAAELARRLGSPEALASCALGLAGDGKAVSAWIADEVRLSLLEEALEALGDRDDELRASVSAELAKALYFSGEEWRRDELAQEAVEIAHRIGSPTALVAAMSASRVVLCGPAHIDLRRAVSDEMVDLSEQAGDAELAIRARLRRLENLFQTGNRTTVDRELTTVLDLAERLRQPYYLWRAIAWDTLRLVVDGRLLDAERRIADGFAVWPGEPNVDAVTCAEVQLASIRLLQGKAGECERGIRSVADSFGHVPSYGCFLALLLADQQRYSEAAVELDKYAADGFVSPPFDSNWLFGITALSYTCVMLGDAARAATLYDLLRPFATQTVVLNAFGGGGGWLGPASHHLGLLAATMGREQEAESWSKAAMDASSNMGASMWAKRARSLPAWDAAKKALVR